MITDARVLQPEFIPREVQHRDPEVNQLSRALDPITRGEPPQSALLLGPSGTGKTCIAQFTVERLRREVVQLNTVYINGWKTYTRFRVLSRILENIGKTTDIHRQATPKDELLERLNEYAGPPYVVILDEVDQLEDTRVVYDLVSTPRIAPVLVANREEDFLQQLDTRIVSRLQSARRIHFDRYSLDALVAILRDRVQWGLRQDAIEEKHLERIADHAAGDACEAIEILRNAAQEARAEGHDAITSSDVSAAVPTTREELRQKDLDKLNSYQRTLFEIVTEAGPLSPSEIYERYAGSVDDPRTDRTVRSYLKKLRRYNLLAADGEGPSRTYQLLQIWFIYPMYSKE